MWSIFTSTTIINAVKIIQVRFAFVSVCVCVEWLCSTLKAGFIWDNNRRNRLICQHVNGAHQIMTFLLVSAIVMPKSSLFGSSKVNLGCVGVFVFFNYGIKCNFSFCIHPCSCIPIHLIEQHPNTKIKGINDERKENAMKPNMWQQEQWKTILQSGVIARVQAARAQNLGPLFQRSPQCNYYPSMLL